MFLKIKNKRFRFFPLLIFLLFALPFSIAFARMGVGVGMGKIVVDQPLKLGQIHLLPSIAILNTGDEASNYEVGIQYHEGVPQFRPAREWFSFNPREFYLKPGGIQQVEVRLTLPLKAQPGEYFAYVEGRPVVKSRAGVSQIGIAAATKLYFTLVPANIFQAITFRISSFMKLYAPWTWASLGIVIFAIVAVIIKRTFSFQIGVKKK